MDLKQYKLIQYGAYPCWYELAWSDEPLGIIIRLHRDLIKKTGPINLEAPIVEHFIKGFGFESFGNTFNGDFGFNNAFKFIKVTNDNFAEFLVEIPAIKIRTNNQCNSCNGKGKDEFMDRDCFICEATGREIKIDWDKAYSISATFNVFTMFFNYPEFETSTERKQLLVFNIATLRDMHGGGIGGHYSIPLTNWLKSFDINYSFDEISNVLQKVWAKMFGKLNYLEHYKLKAYIGSTRGYLIIDVPGDATGIHGADHYNHEGFGNQFSCHNVDNPMQQLALIAGLAKLHDIARGQIG